jgi:hypothetical protein
MIAEYVDIARHDRCMILYSNRLPRANNREHRAEKIRWLFRSVEEMQVTIAVSLPEIAALLGIASASAAGRRAPSHRKKAPPPAGNPQNSGRRR